MKKLKKLLYVSVLSILSVCFAFMFSSNLGFVENKTQEAFAADETSPLTGVAKSECGALYIGDENGSAVSYVMTGGVLDGQSARYGSAMYICAGATVTIKSATIRNNRAKYGLICIEKGGSLVLDGPLTLENNQVEYGNVSLSSLFYGEEASDCVTATSNFQLINSGNEQNVKFDIDVTYYVDGTEYVSTEGGYEQIGTMFNDYATPVGLNECSGYFTDANMTNVLSGEAIPSTDLKLYTATATDGLVYTLNSAGTAYTVTGVESGVTLPEKVVIPAMYNGLAVTAVGSSCFDSRTEIKEVVFGANIDTIEVGAFASCSLDKVTIHNNIEVITKNAFINADINEFSVSDYNPNFTDLSSSGLFTYDGKILIKASNQTTSIPSGVEVISGSAYSGLKTISFVYMADSVTTIEMSAFEGVTSLQSVTLSDNITTIDAGAFYGCSGITSLNIPSKIATISGVAFAGCSSWNDAHDFDVGGMDMVRYGSMVLPDTLTSIGPGAFAGCSSLTFVYIPSTTSFLTTASSASESPFYGCSESLEIAVKDTDTNALATAWGTYWNYYGDYSSCTTYYGFEYGTNYTATEELGSSGSQLCSYEDIVLVGYYGSDSNVIIPKATVIIGGVSDGTKITKGAFEDNKTIEDLKIQDDSSLLIIGQKAFSGCSNLTTVYFGNTVCEIGSQAFCGTNIYEISLPSSMVTICDLAFGEIQNLGYIYLPKNVQNIYGKPFVVSTTSSSSTLYTHVYTSATSRLSGWDEHWDLRYATSDLSSTYYMDEHGRVTWNYSF